VSLIGPSNKENEAVCPHFGECGGCQTQQIPYAEQLLLKEEALRTLFGSVWAEAIPVTPSPVQWHYRNKVDPSFAPMQYPEAPPPGFIRETVLGFKRKGRWFFPIAINDCLIGPEGLAELIGAVRAWHREAGLRAYDSRTQQGFLQCLLVRDAKRTGERMVALITRPGAFDAAGFVDMVRKAFNPVSIYRGISTGTSDAAFAEELELLYGVPDISEHLRIPSEEGERKFQFRISPFSFFQTNPLATERLYGIARAWVQRTGAEYLYDLYGGMGSIAFSCADWVEHVWSVESVSSATEDGRRNAKDNEIRNVTFITAPVEAYLRERAGHHPLEPGAAVIVDPPRAGLHPKALKYLLELHPRHLLYISCNPAMLAREMEALRSVYRLRQLQAVDLFPHTRHVEVVAEFEVRQA